MDFAGAYHFIFETYVGLGILMGGCLVLCVVLAFVLEIRTRKRFADRGEKVEDDSWDSEEDDDSQDG